MAANLAEEALVSGTADTQSQTEAAAVLHGEACARCGCTFESHALVRKSKHTAVCALCNRLTVMLTRHLGVGFLNKLQGSSGQERKDFWKHLAQKHAADKNLSYQRVKDTLTTRHLTRAVTEHLMALGGEFLPLSVYRQRGYSEQEVKNIEKNCAFYRSEELEREVFCLRVLSTCHRELRQKVDEEFLEAERGVRKQPAAAKAAPANTQVLLGRGDNTQARPERQL